MRSLKRLVAVSACVLVGLLGLPGGVAHADPSISSISQNMTNFIVTIQFTRGVSDSTTNYIDITSDVPNFGHQPSTNQGTPSCALVTCTETWTPDTRYCGKTWLYTATERTATGAQVANPVSVVFKPSCPAGYNDKAMSVHIVDPTLPPGSFSTPQPVTVPTPLTVTYTNTEPPATGTVALEAESKDDLKRVSTYVPAGCAVVVFLLAALLILNMRSEP